MWPGCWGNLNRPLKLLGGDGFSERQQLLFHRFAFFFIDIEFDADALGELAFDFDRNLTETVHMKFNEFVVSELSVYHQPCAAG